MSIILLLAVLGFLIFVVGGGVLIGIIVSNKEKNNR